MGKKTPPFKHHPEWTEARFWTFVRSALRRAWLKWPPRYKALAAAKRTVVGKRHKYEYQCAKCKKWWKQKEIQVDHRVDAGKLTKYDDLSGFVERLFVSEEHLDILCKTCHTAKTNKSRTKPCQSKKATSRSSSMT